MDHNNRFGAFYGGTREDLLRAYRDQGLEVGGGVGGDRIQGLYEQQKPQMDPTYAAAWEQRRAEWERLHRGHSPGITTSGVQSTSMLQQRGEGRAVSSIAREEKELCHREGAPWGVEVGHIGGMVQERKHVQLVPRQEREASHIDIVQGRAEQRSEGNNVDQESFVMSGGGHDIMEKNQGVGND